MKPSSSSPFCLLVEGQDDRHVIQHLWEKAHKEKLSFNISDKDGISNLIEAIPGEIKEPSREILGIVLDANNHLDEYWKEITHKIKEGIEDLGVKQIQVPDHPIPTGTIINCKEISIGVWLMPNNKSSGEIENFVIEMLPKSDPVWPSAKKYIEDIPEESRKFDNNKIKKAQLFAWLATRKKPGRMGAAISAGDLTLDNKLSKSFLKWLSDLFNEKLKEDGNHLKNISK